jgi:hypothetical protein
MDASELHMLAPPHTALPSPIHRPCENSHFPILKHRHISQPWDIIRLVYSPAALKFNARFPAMSTNTDSSVTSCVSYAHDLCMHMRTCLFPTVADTVIYISLVQSISKSSRDNMIIAIQ